MSPALRQKFVVGNWKMYTNAAEARQLAKAVVDGMAPRSEFPSLSVRLSYLALVGKFSKAAASRLERRTSIPKKKARSPARSVRRCSLTSAANT